MTTTDLPAPPVRPPDRNTVREATWRQLELTFGFAATQPMVLPPWPSLPPRRD